MKAAVDLSNLTSFAKRFLILRKDSETWMNSDPAVPVYPETTLSSSVIAALQA